MAPRRVKNVAITRPIVYGNSAIPLTAEEKADPKKNIPPDHSHKWTVFVRDPTDPSVKLDYFIKKVIFKLHDTYHQPSRSIESAPFEVTETGWGEFEIGIRIFFATAAGEKNILLYHQLKLHPYGVPPGQEATPEPVESFLYDELVFNEPTEAMFEILTSQPGALLPAKTDESHKYSQQAENEELDRLSKAMENVFHQVQKTKEHIKKLEGETPAAN